jgi:hypothetical protein
MTAGYEKKRKTLRKVVDGPGKAVKTTLPLKTGELLAATAENIECKNLQKDVD